eukprot:gene56630-biopygen113805
MVEQPLPTVSKWYELEAERFSDCVAARKGIVDTFSGDHFFGSFGAMRPCGAHHRAAASTAFSISGGDEHLTTEHCEKDAPLAHASTVLRFLERTSVVCSGEAVAGDFGNEQMQRTMLIGGIINMTAVVERLAARWRVRVLTDSATYDELRHSFNCRARERVVFPKGGAGPVLLWQMVAEKELLASSTDSQNVTGDCIFEEDDFKANPWQEHNDALQSWVSGDGSEKTRAPIL